MQKNIITNKITPCCGLPFSVIYWWVSNLTLNSDADRQFIISNISQNGIISIDGWKVLVNSGTLEADASLTKAEFLAWFDCGRQPSCEQLKIIIEGFQVGNWTPETELPLNIGLIDAIVNGQNFNGNVYTKEQVNSLLTTSFGGDLVVSDNPQPTTAKWYFAKENGTYSNAGGLVVDLTNKLVILNYDGTTWGKVEIELQKGADGKTIENWSAKSFAQGSQVFKDEAIWENPNGIAASTDVPGNSQVWVKRLAGGIGEVLNQIEDHFSYSGAIYGKYLSANGAETFGTSFFISKYYSCNEGENWSCNFGDTHLVYYNADKSIHSIVQGLKDWELSVKNHDFVIPKGAAFFRYSTVINSDITYYAKVKRTSLKTSLIEKPINELFGKEGADEYTYGLFSGKDTMNATSGMFFLQKGFKVPADTQISGINVNVSGTGNINIVVFSLDAWGTMYNHRIEYVVPVVDGVNNITGLNFDVRKNDLIGVRPDSNISLKYSETGGGLGCIYGSSVQSIPAEHMNLQGNTFKYDCSFILKAVSGGLIWKVNKLFDGNITRELDLALLVLGDSITDPVHTSWFPRFLQKLTWKKGYKNVALSGARYGMSGLDQSQRLSRTTAYGQVLKAIEDTSFTPDVVLIYLGVNDNHSLYNDSVFDTTYNRSVDYIAEATTNINNAIFDNMIGGMRLAIDKLMQVYPNAEIIVATPLGDSDVQYSNKAAKAVIEGSWRSGVKLIDLYGRQGINPMLEPKVKDTGMLHLSDYGSTYVANVFSKELIKMFT